MQHLCVSLRSLLATALLFCSSFALAQSPQPLQTLQPRLHGPIHGPNRVPLAGSRDPHTRIARDLGGLPASTTIPGVTLVFNRSAAQQADLQLLLAAQQDRNSPQFHRWLAPADFAARFGMAPADIAAVATWLSAQGFHIDNLGPTRDRITFTGTAAQLQSAFGADLHRFRTPEGELHFAPATGLTLPEDLAPLTAAVLHLADFRPQPDVHALPHPDFTAASNQAHFLTPADLATLYDLAPLYTAATTQNHPNASGEYLAIVGQSYIDDTPSASSISDFQMVASLQNLLTPVLVPGSGSEAVETSAEGEGEIDVEYASGIAPQVNLLYVFVGSNQNYNVFDALAFAIQTNVAPVINISYSECELLMSSTDLNAANALFQQAAAQGQSLVSASGDDGSTGCARATQQATVPQQQALAVNFPASSPFVTAVGGTQLAPGTFAAGSSSFWASASTSDLISSVLSYIPEVAWNEDSPTEGIFSSAGGSSAAFARPAWQTGVPGIPSGAFRLVPDIALQASMQNPGFLICTRDASLFDNQGQTSSCDTGLLGSNGQPTTSGGTSFAAPVLSGFVALLNAATSSQGQGLLNPELYSLASDSSTYAALFHDITSGSNACTAGDGTCASPGQSGFSTTPGYDLVTGLGSLDLGKVAAAWPTSAKSGYLGTFTLLQVLTSEGTGGPAGGQITVGPTTGSQANPPTGTLSLSLDGAPLGDPLQLSPGNGSENAVAQFAFTAPNATGSHVLTATYAGDATHLGSTGTAILSLGTLTAPGSFAVSASPISTTANGTGTSQITVTPADGFDGRVVWSLAFTGSGYVSSCYTVDSLPVNGPSSTTLTLGVGSACSSSLATSSRAASKPRAIPRPSPAAPVSSSRSTALAALAGGLLACSFLLRRRRVPCLLALMCVLPLGFGPVGCGGGSSSGGGGITSPPPVSSATYTLSLTGKDSVNGSITASTTLTLTVQ